MKIFELFIIAVGLSMDAFAVAICKGLEMKKTTIIKSIIVGLYFGLFQMIMPLIGYLLGDQFSKFITEFDHWIAFGLLAVIGGKMIKESFEKYEMKDNSAPLHFKIMFPLAVATSIDALAMGVGFAVLEVNIFLAIIFIGSITFTISAAGVKIGSVFGAKFKSHAEFAGGLILIFMGVKILLEHLEVIGF